MSKRIIFTVTNDLVFDRRMQRICTTLANNGYAVELVGRYLKKSPSVVRQNFLQTRLSCLFNKEWLFYAEFNIRLFFYLLFSKVDVICGCDLDTLPAAWLAARLKRAKVVYDAHEYFTESPELIGRRTVQGIWLLLEKFLVPKVDAAYTVTNSIAGLFQKKYSKQFEVIRNMPNYNEPVRRSITEKYILYQGAVNLGRGVKEMLLVMMQLENIQFYVAGDGDSMDEMISLVKQYKLENKVKLLGKQTPAALKTLTDNAYLGVNLLENRGLNYYYSLGNKFFDYVQSHVPQVSIAFPEYIALNDQYHIAEMVDELTIEKITAAFQEVLNDENRYAELKMKCASAAKELCWENEEQKLLDIYKKL